MNNIYDPFDIPYNSKINSSNQSFDNRKILNRMNYNMRVNPKNQVINDILCEFFRSANYEVIFEFTTKNNFDITYTVSGDDYYFNNGESGYRTEYIGKAHYGNGSLMNAVLSFDSDDYLQVQKAELIDLRLHGTELRQFYNFHENGQIYSVGSHTNNKYSDRNDSPAFQKFSQTGEVTEYSHYRDGVQHCETGPAHVENYYVDNKKIQKVCYFYKGLDLGPGPIEPNRIRETYENAMILI